MQKTFLLFLLFIALRTSAQELYVFSEPASNMPARSISVKFTAHNNPYNRAYSRSAWRIMPEVMFGFSKKFMLHIGGTIADMNTQKFKPESAFIYGKYRFLSFDEVHKHFRMAVFANASYTTVPFHFDEASLMGDKKGAELGLIATQLWDKFALSGTIGHTQLFDESRYDDVVYVPERIYQTIDYSVSAGYLLLPRVYTDYKQLNLNLYLEFLGQRSLDRKAYYIDMAPAVQIIFNSNSKLNIGHRFQLGSDMWRMATYSWLISFERTFLNAFNSK